MATLVLSAVGTAIGGPLGGAVGAIIGQQVDRTVLAPKGRAGPRLTDLRVQAARYGAEIPAIYGAMRVAGTLIWSTDLIERKATSGGSKSRPSTTTYAYSVSFALALSSRAIGGIGRIWADGNLLRGAAGDMKVRATLRIHPGDADQPVDPLIAAAVGLDTACAFRGLAYLVFEDLDLTDFGGRIPLLTVEVFADEEGDPWTLVATGFGARPLPAAPDRPALAGYAATGDTHRDALMPLVSAWGLRIAGAGRDAELADDLSGGAPTIMYGVDGLPFSLDDIEWVRRDAATRPQTIRIQHYDPDRDGQIGQQSALVTGEGRGERLIEAPVSMTAQAAQRLVQQRARALLVGGDRARVTTGLSGLAFGPGTTTRLVDGSIWRVGSLSIEGSGCRIELVRVDIANAIAATMADSGQPVRAPDAPVEDGTVAVLDLPAFDAATARTPQVMLAGSGSSPGWRGADAWFVGGADQMPEPLGRVTQAALFGVLAEALDDGETTVADRRRGPLVRLAHPGLTPEPVPVTALSGTRNLVLIGDELVQFAQVEPAGTPSEWRLGHLLRGRYGSVPRRHPVGTRVISVSRDTMLPIPADMVAAMDATAARVEWAGLASAAAVHTPVGPTGRSLLPLAPVHGVVRRVVGGHRVDWIARSATDWIWRDGVDVAFDDGALTFRVFAVGPDGQIERTVNASHTLITVSEVEALGGLDAIDVCAVGPRGVSPALRIAM